MPVPMNEIDFVRAKLMALSGEERFVMGAQMSERAREMVKASLPPGLSQAEQRRQLFQRLYGKEIDVDLVFPQNKN